MGKFFGGMVGGGKGSKGSGKTGDSNSLTSGSSLERAMAAKQAAEKMKGGKGKNGGKLSAEERYQQLMQSKIEANKAALLSGTNRSNNTLVGNKQPDAKQSKTTQLTMELLAAKMAKNQLKKAKKNSQIEVKPTFIGGAYGGHIDKKGRVTNSSGQQVLQIDLKTGKIKTLGLFSRTIGKYDPKSTYCLYKIQKRIEEFNIKKGLGTTNIWGNKTDGNNENASYNAWNLYYGSDTGED